MGVTGHLLHLKVHISTLPSINERTKSSEFKTYKIQNIKTFYRLYLLPSSRERYSACTLDEQRHKKLSSSIDLERRSLKAFTIHEHNNIY